LVLIVGPFAAQRVDTRGLERNPLAALVRTSIPRVQAETLNRDWRASIAAGTTVEDFTKLRGRAAGMNVLLVVLESTGAQYLLPYGAAKDPMPNLSALASRALVFDNAYAVYPESIKEIVAILSSRYPALDVAAERHAGIAAPSLASALSSAGYNTALFHSGRFMYLGMDAIVAQLGFAKLADAGDLGGRRDSSFGVDEPSAVESLLQWIDTRNSGQPFFAAYLPIAGHHPYTHAQAGPFPNEDEVDRYRNSLYDGDRALGQLIAGLQSRGLDRKTMIIVMADHGEAFGQHEGNYGHNLALFDENVRVPLLIVLPAANRATHIQRTVSLLDVAPTVLELLGLPAQPAFQGESLLSPQPRAALFFTDYSLALVGLRDACFKFIHAFESGRSRLFDVCRDPGERADLASRFPGHVREYRERLRAWSGAQVANVTRYAAH
jgi:phosphoglycerol transferase MdoB-like AlkP superfamily enzyme